MASLMLLFSRNHEAKGLKKTAWVCVSSSGLILTRLRDWKDFSVVSFLTKDVINSWFNLILLCCVFSLMD